ncbi:MAG TPA: hypothetical protein VGD97_12355 [Lacunisphaera sp.]
MSTPTVLFAIYFAIGLALMIIALALPGKWKRTKGFETSTVGTGDPVDAVFLVFIALLWPIWVIGLFGKKDPNQ